MEKNKSVELMERMGMINEKSINAKKRDIERVEKTFENGNNTYIKCFAVLTAENPDSQKASNSYNKKANKNLFKALKTQYTIIPTQGKFGNVENSFLVFNIDRSVVEYYCGQNEQTSFIFSKVEGGKVISEYWEKQDVTQSYDKVNNPYVLKDTCDDWVDMSGADDYYTIVGNKFKYSIPFSIFEDYNNRLGKLLNEVTDKETMLNFLIEGVGFSAFYNRTKYRVKM